ncbi:MAG: TetR/AcrR family transcriptional regulator [Rhodospirillaceae bacterium]|nr:TetR/AcrR family transcriptional regulator [Rhodospirillaceae bacterium]
MEHKGFNHTSMDDLINETGVSRYGIYGTFGNKRVFFQAALARYAQHRAKHMQDELRKLDADLECTINCFMGLKGLANSEAGELGCLVCNAATELGPYHVRSIPETQTLRDSECHAQCF